MRPYRSITGPLVLILLGSIFLLHTFSPNVRIFDLLGQYWPFILIGWGVVGLIEASVQFSLNRAIPVNGISGGGWFLVVIICLIGFAAFQFQRHRQEPWWQHLAFNRGMEVLGTEHEFPVVALERAVGRTPHVVLENFRGDAKLTGTDALQLTLTGHKVIHALNDDDAKQADQRTPVEIETKGNVIIVRCNQDRASSNASVATDLEIQVPKGSSVEATGTHGDFDVSALTGDVDISSENAGLRLQNVAGNVKLDTRRSDLIRCTDVGGTVDLRGHGTDVELSRIAGQVTMTGSYGGSVSLQDLAKPVRVENLRTEFTVQRVPGEIRLERGSVTMRNVVGPTRLTTRTTDVTLDDYTSDLEVTADKGDIELRPGRLPVGKMTVHTRSGNIELTVPQTAVFAMKASTESGDITNDFGGGLQGHSEGHGARLEGAVGAGPDLSLATNRGSITLRKASGETSSPRLAFNQNNLPPELPKQPERSERPERPEKPEPPEKN